MSERTPDAPDDIEPLIPKPRSLRAVITVVLVAVTGGAAWAGVNALSDDGAIQPSETSPTPSATVTPSLIASVDEFGRALPGLVTVDDSLPSAEPLPTGIWETVTSGWTLAIVAPRDEGLTPEHQVLYLASPEGLLYQVLELDPTQPVGLLAWSAGQPRAIVTLVDSWESADYFYSQVNPTHALDLETGTLSDVTNGASAVEAASNGGLVWSYFSREDDVVDAWISIERGGETTTLEGHGGVDQFSPDGRYFTVWGGPDGWVGAEESLVDSETAEVVPFDYGSDWYCGVFVWLDADTYLGSCGQELGSQGFYEMNVRTGERTDLDDATVNASWPMVSASCTTADGQSWGAWLEDWGEWYEPWTVTVGGGSGEQGEVPILDPIGTPYERTHLLGCGPDSLIVLAEHTGDEYGEVNVTENALLAYWPDEDRQAVVIPRPVPGDGWDYYLWSVVVSR